MILVVAFIGFIGFMVLGIFYDLTAYFFLEAKSHLSPYFFAEKHKAFLEKNFAYYQKLPTESKKIYVQQGVYPTKYVCSYG